MENNKMNDDQSQARKQLVNGKLVSNSEEPEITLLKCFLEIPMAVTAHFVLCPHSPACCRRGSSFLISSSEQWEEMLYSSQATGTLDMGFLLVML